VRRESEDKAERILSIYSRLKMGKVIFKEKESNDFGVATRTIQRDIADIQCFLQNQTTESGELQEIIFDKKVGGYVLQTKQNSQLEGKEILTVAKVLLESRSLMKSELFPIIHKLIGLCGDENEEKMVEELLKNEMHHYVELKHGKLLLERLWQLEQAVKKQKYIEVQYKKLKNQEIVTRKIKPVGIMFSDFYYYLTAFIDDIDKEEKFQNPNDIYPTIYRVDRFMDIKILEEHFSIPYAERFEEGEFRKRVQFMYGGELRKITMKCNNKSLETVLDRFPTAEILSQDGEEYIVRAEVFGDGVDMWLRGQKDSIEIK
jgi:predicted DNA-binding transcriptional regulator YafY